MCYWFLIAQGLIAAVMAVRNIDTIHFSSRTKENAERLAQEVANNYNVSTKVFEEADDAMEEADVVVTATNSNHPVYSHSLHRRSFKRNRLI